MRAAAAMLPCWFAASASGSPHYSGRLWPGGQPKGLVAASGGCDATESSKVAAVSASRDAEFTEYASARLPALRRLAVVLCQDWQAADDLVQVTITKLYVHWDKAEQRSYRCLREGCPSPRVRPRAPIQLGEEVRLTGGMADRQAGEVDHDAVLDLRGAVAALPPRQRAVLVLRFYCDLNVDQSAQVLDCSPGTVKSQTAKANSALRRVLAAGHGGRPDVDQGRSGYREVPDHG